MKEIIMTNRDQLDDDFFADLRKMVENGGCRIKITKLQNGRSLPQNASLHLWLTQMATLMNEAGYSHRKLWKAMKESFDIPVTMEMLKEIAQNVSLDRFNEKRTSKLTTVQFSELYEILNSAFGGSVGISLPFPSDEPPMP